MKISSLEKIRQELSEHYITVNSSPSFKSLMELSNSYSQMSSYYKKREEYSLANMYYRKAQIIRKAAVSSQGPAALQRSI